MVVVKDESTLKFPILPCRNKSCQCSGNASDSGLLLLVGCSLHLLLPRLTRGMDRLFHVHRLHPITPFTPDVAQELAAAG